ncbi:MAG: glyceraldehyde-3-phosphate dehydrogenase [Saprospiraceae bacterium]
MEKSLEVRQLRNLELARWREQEKTALDLLQVVGELRFDRGIDLTLFRHQIYDTRPSEMLRAHEVGQAYTKRPIDIDLTLSIAYAVAQIKDLGACKVDIGRLATEWLAEAEAFENLDAFVSDRLTGFSTTEENTQDDEDSGCDVVLYGFGRIGRAVTRLLVEQTGRGNQLRLRAIVLRAKLADRHEELTKRIALLTTDSIHGEFAGMAQVSPDGEGFIINGNHIPVIFANKPEDLDYTDFGIRDALLIDNTGVWRDRAGLERHLRPGIKSVLLTAPGDEVPNIVVGINHDNYNWENVRLASAASCTTNAVAPLIQVLNEKLGIERAHIETIHAFTSDQNLLDNFHKKPRRGRAAPLNMVVTSTGAAKAVTKVMPSLEGKLTGNAVRVPVPNGSLAILQITTSRPVNKDEVNEIVRQASLNGPLCEQIMYSASQEYVSSNIVGETSTSVFDAPSTKVSSDGFGLSVYAWYDNEFGYSCQVMRLAKRMAGVHRKRFI